MPRRSLYAKSNEKRLDGVLAAITGGNSGIGLETVRELSRRGARILSLCRDVDKAEKVARDIAKDTNGVIEVIKLDLASLKSVRECAERILEKEEKLDLLVNNAGVCLCSKLKTEDGFDMHFGTNHLGHFLLTELLMPLVLKGDKPRIVSVSSKAHILTDIHFDDLHFERRNYGKWNSYGQSKLANILHSKQLAKKHPKIICCSLHPGTINTDASRHLNQDTFWSKPLLKMMKPFLMTCVEGAQTTIFCILDDKVKSGVYYDEPRHEKRPSANARNEETAEKLWRVSQELVGLKPPQ